MSRRPENMGGTTRDDDLRLEPAQITDRHVHNDHGTHVGAEHVAAARPVDVTDRTHEVRSDHRPLTRGYGNGTAIAAFVLGMFGISYALTGILAPIALLVGLIALGMGIKGLSNSKRMEGH